MTNNLRGWTRRLLWVRAAEAAAVGGIVGGLAAVAALVVGLVAGREAIGVWAVLALPGGALVGALYALARGVSPAATARLLDRRCALRERLTTAVELEARGDVTPAAQHVCRQASDAIHAVPPRLALWRHTARTPATLVVVGLLVAILGVAAAARRGNSTVERLLAVLDGATQARRDAVAESFRAAAETAGPEAAERLRRAAELVELENAEELRDVLARLEREGVQIGRAVPEDIATAAGLDGGGARRDGGEAPAEGDLQPGERQEVRVFDPAYAATAGEASGTGDAMSPTRGFDDAWSAARARAAEQLGRGRVPAEYRGLVRRFYGLQLTSGE
ncbi:MAG: hypothetical protein GVY16_03030 [Planctomycetes bacterium]|nr:hypothetical protein [Planctomycetota bacterium]